MGAKFLADTLGHRNAIATDVGGTSFDVGLIHEGVALTTSKATYNQYTFYSPRIEMLSIGSGGGSVIWIDELSGTLRVVGRIQLVRIPDRRAMGAAASIRQSLMRR